VLQALKWAQRQVRRMDRWTPAPRRVRSPVVALVWLEAARQLGQQQAAPQQQAHQMDQRQVVLDSAAARPQVSALQERCHLRQQAAAKVPEMPPVQANGRMGQSRPFHL
jgi:hypothetical protein